MRVVTYSRYSSDQQRAASIPDQQRICRMHAERERWDIVAEFKDEALSAASMMRPGLQLLLAAAAAGTCDVVLAESLDRLSRDIEDTAGIFKRLTFARVRIVTVSEGDISQLHVGFRGTMNALYLSDLAEKTHRGLRGRVEAGRSGGGRCYGYRVVVGSDGENGAREIDVVEAAVVQRIFREFVEGVSPKRIAKRLNAERVPGPRGKGAATPWSPSTIHGHAARGTGILNNELYLGVTVWNRQKFVKDPDTRKRVARLNPESEWVRKGVPHLRIIDDATWRATKARQAATRAKMATGIVHAKRPKYLFSGLTKCAACGGGYTLSSHDLLTCFNARERGTCTNRRGIRRQDVEARVLRAMQTRFLEPGRFEKFCQGYVDELEQRRRAHRALMADHRRELMTIEKSLRKLVDALKAGAAVLSVKDELHALEARRASLKDLLAEPPLPALHPSMAGVFHKKALTLAAGLEDEDRRDAAREALRGFLTRIVIPAGEERLQVEGNFGEMLAAAQGRQGGLAHAVGYGGCGGVQPFMPTPPRDLYVVAA